MKLLVFAATPPPPHGQARMVELMLEGLRETPPESESKDSFEIHHINCRLATSLDDMGRRPWAKILPLLRYLIQARRILRDHAIDAIYYCPGRATLNNALRDLLALSVLRAPIDSPFRILHSSSQPAPALLLHWHAVGLESGIGPLLPGPFLYRALHRWVSNIVHALLKPRFRAARHIALSQWHAGVLKEQLGIDATVIPYGIPDPASEKPEFKIPNPKFQGSAKHLLFMSMLTQEKGFLDTLAVHRELLRRWLEGKEPQPWCLNVAGSFIDSEGRRAWEEARTHPVLQEAQDRANEPLLKHHGFVSGEAKAHLFQQADVFCFPTRYHAESFGLVVLEAMAWGVPVVATDWRALPEILGPGYPYVLPASYPNLEFPVSDWATAISSAATSSIGPALRQRFLDNYHLTEFKKRIRLFMIHTRSTDC
jgi:glycosyltransferase involved in cell wall biosynthesis